MSDLPKDIKRFADTADDIARKANERVKEMHESVVARLGPEAGHAFFLCVNVFRTYDMAISLITQTAPPKIGKETINYLRKSNTEIAAQICGMVFPNDATKRNELIYISMSAITNEQQSTDQLVKISLDLAEKVTKQLRKGANDH